MIVVIVKDGGVNAVMGDGVAAEEALAGRERQDNRQKLIAAVANTTF